MEEILLSLHPQLGRGTWAHSTFLPSATLGLKENALNKEGGLMLTNSCSVQLFNSNGNPVTVSGMAGSACNAKCHGRDTPRTTFLDQVYKGHMRHRAGRLQSTLLKPEVVGIVRAKQTHPC